MQRYYGNLTTDSIHSYLFCDGGGNVHTKITRIACPASDGLSDSADRRYSLGDTLHLVVGQGVLRLHQAYTIAIFGSMLSVLMQKTKVAENLIKKGAELSGDNPWMIAVVILLLIALLFTSLGGLGAIIMVATIALPIMVSVGMGNLTVIGIFLFGLSMGGILNAGNWALYIEVLNLETAQIRSFALVMFALLFISSLFYITIQLYRDGHDLNFKKIFTASGIILGLAAVFILLWNILPATARKHVLDIGRIAGTAVKFLVLAAIAASVFFNIYRILFKRGENKKIHASAFFTPLIPLALILLFDMNFLAAFFSGLVYGFIATYKKGAVNTLVRSIFEGGAVAMPAVALMMGIGMLLNAIIGPGGDFNAFYPDGWPVLNLLQPVMLSLVPGNAFFYVLVFTLAAPLALYRGPLNLWGMGYGLAAVFLAAGMPGASIMGLLMSVGMLQSISDPTNTHNVWLANEMQIDVQKVLWNTLPYTWALAAFGLTIASLMFYI
ncbi:MAG: citrate transporter [Candidatus Marinimicrobia bacterium]|nr:citrate transporter [Candidatus Neomarinimicrobiota bacterium]